MIDLLRAAFVRRLTEDSKTKDRRRREYNLALFMKDGPAIWANTDLHMVMEKFDAAIREVSRCDGGQTPAGPAPVTAPCGTDPAYHTHRRRGQQPCPDCLAAHSRYTRSRRTPTPDPIAIDRACAGHPPEKLTITERRAAITRLLDHGHSHTEIARRLRISRSTVNRHSRKVA